MCRQCPANVDVNRLARCVGRIDQKWMRHKEEEAQLRGVVSRLGLEREIAELFPQTTRLWRGLWAVSPVPPKALPVLRQVLAGLQEDDLVYLNEPGHERLAGRSYFDDLRRTISAIEIAEHHGLRFHVSVPPPGHTDFGHYTIFPHCPFCKEPSGHRWQSPLPTDSRLCDVCGTSYSPAATASDQKMNDEISLNPLREMLGEEEFAVLFHQYLLRLGESPDRAAAMVKTAEQEHQEWMAEMDEEN